MDKINSTPSERRGKPAKPYPDFPLFPHAAGVWAKKIRGKLYYFGPWSDPDAALADYFARKDDLHAGHTTPATPDADATVKDAINAFLNAKQAAVDSGELSPRTFREYLDICTLTANRLGKTRRVADLRPDDFAALRKHMAERWSFYHLSNAIQYVRCLFKHAADSDLIDRPVRFGPGFQRPSKKTIRLYRASRRGSRLFTAEEVRRMIDAAGIPLKAMLLLGINCGFGNSDCGNLPLSAVDLERGRIQFPRPKTGVDRRCMLWPDTVDALRAALARRPEPKSETRSALFFITKYGLSWHKETPDGPISKETAKLLKTLGIDGGRGFYTLRHTFRTVADETKDQPAAFYVMGHEIPDMSSIYREDVSDTRLRAVSDYVRQWLFAG